MKIRSVILEMVAQLREIRFSEQAHLNGGTVLIPMDYAECVWQRNSRPVSVCKDVGGIRAG